MHDIKNAILTQIKNGEVAMRPRWHFVLRTVLLVLGLLISVLATVWMASFVLFMLRHTGAVYAPQFGAPAFVPFLMSIPWILILLAVVFMVVMEVLVKRFSFAHQKPLLYSVIGIVFISFAGTYLLLQTPMHQSLQQRADSGRHLPLVGGMYRHYADQTPQDLTFGTITAVTEKGYTITDPKGDEIQVQTTDRTRTRQADINKLKENQQVIIFGKRNDTTNTIQAQAIRPAPDTFRPIMRERLRSQTQKNQERPDREEYNRTRQESGVRGVTTSTRVFRTRVR